jgi:hypothetical protein
LSLLMHEGFFTAAVKEVEEEEVIAVNEVEEEEVEEEELIAEVNALNEVKEEEVTLLMAQPTLPIHTCILLLILILELTLLTVLPTRGLSS